MKPITALTIIFLTLIENANSQDFLLLDRRWNKPAIMSDTVTKDDLSSGLYPIYLQELDSLILHVEKFKNLKKDGMSRKFYYSEDFKTSHLIFEIENIKRTYGDGYEINLISNGPFGQVSLKLSDPRHLLPENERVIRMFLSYLIKSKNNLNRSDGKQKSNKKNNTLVN